MRNLLKNKWFKFALWTIIFLLFVLWIGNAWLLFGVLIIYDYYISKKVNWTFWKKRNLKKKSKWIEWVDALVFAVIAASIIRIFFIEAYMIPTPSLEKTLLVGDHLFVSKVSYGPRLPNTPVAIPFTHTIQGSKFKPYWDVIQRPYKRLKGLGKIQRNDIVVFNFPMGDTVVLQNSAVSYYQILRDYANRLKYEDQIFGKPLKSDKLYESLARKVIFSNFSVVTRPVDKKDNYVKRCVGMPGDSFCIKKSDIYINGKKVPKPRYSQQNYHIEMQPGKSWNKKKLIDMGISEEDLNRPAVDSIGRHILPLTSEMVKKIKKFKSVKSVNLVSGATRKGDYNRRIFPHNPRYPWNADYFGTLFIPNAGATVQLDTSNLCLYERIIDVYEKNDLKVKNGNIYINGKLSDSYTFKMNYYFMMGDNRDNSADSRFWGFVPEDHIVGKPAFIWLSLDKEKSWFKGRIRFNRFFKGVKSCD